MKNNFYGWIGLLFIIAGTVRSTDLSAQDLEKRDYRIDISLQGYEDSVAYLGYYRADKMYLIDTADVNDDGQVIFEGQKNILDGVYFLYSKTFRFDFLISGERSFALSTSIDDIFGNMKVDGSLANEQFKTFQLVMIDHQKSVKDITASLDSTSTYADTLSVRERLNVLNEGNKLKRSELKSEFGDSFVGQILVLMDKSPELVLDGDSLTIGQKKEQYYYYKQHFFDGLDFDGEALMRIPSFYGKIKEYIDRVTFQNPDSLIVSIDYLLEKSKNNNEIFRYWLSHFFGEYQNAKIMGMDRVFVHLADNYYLKNKYDWTDSTFMASLKKEMIFLRENQIGLKAPQIYLQDTLKKQTTLYDFNSKYIVLFFYSPTCGHCKKKTPVLHELYKKMDGKFEVIGVNVETDIPEWKKFIKDYELEWISLADPDYRSNFRVQYNVRSTPQVYILDKEKTIIAKKLDVEQIETFINDQYRFDEMSQ